MDIDTLWKKTLDELALEVPSSTFTSSFKKTAALKYEGGALYVSCPNKGSCLVIQTKYSDIVLRVVKKYSPEEVRNIYFQSSPGPSQNKEAPAPLPHIEPNIDEFLKKAQIFSSFSFDSFAVSSSNQIAHAAALAVSQEPGKTYNPFFIWGGVGVGKTHLLHAIARKVLESSPRAKILYCSAEDFTNQLVDAIRTKNTAGFRKRYRALDLLLMDDVQFVSDREFIQEELFHTFNKLQSVGKQIVFTSDKPPKAIKNTEKRLVSRFLSGLVVDIQQPDFELKTAILLIKANLRGLSLSVEAAKTIAAHIEELRELEGFLLKLGALSVSGKELSKELVERLLIQSSSSPSPRHNPKEIIRVVAQELGVKLKDIKDDNRKKQIALARHVAMYFLKSLTSLTYEDIASLLGKKDHTTVMHAVSKIIDSVSKDGLLRQRVERIRLHFSQ